MSLALVYLARGEGGGLESCNSFFEAYSSFPAECAHDLIIIFKGWENIDGLNELKLTSKRLGAKLIELQDNGYDWGAYMRVAPLLEHEWVCFLNTHSRPLVTGWLNLLLLAAESSHKNIGAVGATGSWQSLSPIMPLKSLNVKYNTLLFYPLRLALNWVRLISRIQDFPIFPNPHLRSNALLVRRDIFVSFSKSKKIPLSKLDALKLESGRRGFSMFLKKSGKKILIVGADGKSYEPEDWVCSGTFRVPLQDNLLVEDNQTKGYKLANQSLRRYLEMASWGRMFS